MRVIIFLFYSICFFTIATAQISIRQQEMTEHNMPDDWYANTNIPANLSIQRSNCQLNRMVFGWHPYWQNGYESNYQWNLLSDLCFFGYEVNPSTGNALNTHGWATNAAVTAALNQGTRVHLCVILFSDHATFFGSSTAQNTLIANLVSAVQSRGAHGINIDFEGLPSSQSVAFSNFIINLSNALHAANPSYQLSICLYAVDWSNVFDEPLLTNYVDFFTIMGYDYYWTGSSQAGPNDPLYGFTASYDRSLSRTVTYYRNAGIPSQKLVLGLPYYGREWETTSSAVPSSTTGSNVYSRTFRYVKNNATGYYSSANAQYNEKSVSTAYIFQNAGTWRQCWITEGYAMKKRFDFVNQRDLKGIAIWALGYDDGYTDFWDAIEQKFTDCSVVPCIDTIYDGGGPLTDYYDNENYSFTIAPTQAAQVSLSFQSFATEAGYDTLWIYDGPSTSSPLIGAYQGTNMPAPILSSSSFLTLRFKSDASTRAAGWKAIYQCITDNQPPTTQLLIPPGWITSSFHTSFSDNDNLNLDGTYWNVAGFNGMEWRSSHTNGFFTDHFDSILHSEWQMTDGSWSIMAHALQQSDESVNNTNLYALLNQSLSNEYVYEWKGTTSGSGTNRRSGFHFASDNGALPNRGNSYFVWFRLDNQNLQFYKVTNDVFSLVHTIPFVTIPNQEYLYRVIYNRISGQIRVYVNNQLVGQWTDSNPYANGQYVSFRSGHSIYRVDDFVVYRSRGNVEYVSVGQDSMMSFQNPSPQIPAGRIFSLVKDQVHLFAQSDTLLDVDWTPPIHNGYVWDGSVTDWDTLTNPIFITASWQGWHDPHSGIAEYHLGVGDIPSSDNIIPFTSAMLSDTLQYVPFPSLQYDQLYFHAVKSLNHAGLWSDTVSSNGFVLLLNTATNYILPNTDMVMLYPNPSQSIIYITSNDLIKSLRITDMQGRELDSQSIHSNQWQCDVSSYLPGVYLFWIDDAPPRKVVVTP